MVRLILVALVFVSAMLAALIGAVGVWRARRER